jgi:molecular chaperone DnaK (HSP70)
MSFQIDFGHQKSPIVGIDLGTTNSLVAVMELTGPRILSGIVPSVVSVTESDEVIAGSDARDMLLTHPERRAASRRSN